MRKLLRRIFPPVTRYPSRSPWQWPAGTIDPYRPLEPGEDLAGNVRELALLLDFDIHGPKRLRRVVIA